MSLICSPGEYTGVSSTSNLVGLVSARDTSVSYVYLLTYSDNNLQLQNAELQMMGPHPHQCEKFLGKLNQLVKMSIPV